jgi:hypothetical protein
LAGDGELTGKIAYLSRGRTHAAGRLCFVGLPVFGAGRPAEEDRLRQILLALIHEFVMPVSPERTRELIKLVYPESDPNDSISDVAADVEL